MRTTVELPDDLLRQAKRVALERRTTLRDLLTKGLEKELKAAGTGGDLPKPDSKRLPKLPHEGRKTYDLSDEEIDRLFAGEEESWYGSTR